VHFAITTNAAASAYTFSSGYTNFLNAVSTDVVLNDATNALALVCWNVRNEQRLDKFANGINTPWRSPIEDYGILNVE
jgi:hypothetical protein